MTEADAVCVAPDLAQHLPHVGHEELNVLVGSVFEGHFPGLADRVLLLIVPELLTVSLGLLHLHFVVPFPLFQECDLVRREEEGPASRLLAEGSIQPLVLPRAEIFSLLLLLFVLFIFTGIFFSILVYLIFLLLIQVVVMLVPYFLSETLLFSKCGLLCPFVKRNDLLVLVPLDRLQLLFRNGRPHFALELLILDSSQPRGLILQLQLQQFLLLGVIGYHGVH